MTEQLKPEPVPTHVKCSICNEPWGSHVDLLGEGEMVSLMTCILVLRAELSKRPQTRHYGGSPFDDVMLAAGGDAYTPMGRRS